MRFTPDTGANLIDRERFEKSFFELTSSAVDCLLLFFRPVPVCLSPIPARWQFLLSTLPALSSDKLIS